MAKYPFLSDKWLEAARHIYAEVDGGGTLATEAAPVPVRANLVVTDVPFSPSPLQAHVDTAAGRLAIDKGHVSEPNVTVSLDYATARALFVTGDAQAALQAFLSGRIKVAGDLTKLLDPRSGIWPSGGLAGSGTSPSAGGWSGQGAGGAGADVAGPGGAAPGAAPGAGAGGAAAAVADIHARLQEITE